MTPSARSPPAILAGSSGSFWSVLPRWRIQCRTTAMVGSWLYCSKFIHCIAWPWSQRSFGQYFVPCAR
jgi:hypothetical protein